MKKNLLFLALITLLVGAGCEDIKSNNVDKNEKTTEVSNLQEELLEVENNNTFDDVEMESTFTEKVEKVENEKNKSNDNDDEEKFENQNEYVNSDKKMNVTPKTTEPVTTTNTKSFTIAEVQTANSEQKCWTAVSGKVYDLTPALNKHPGGKANIMLLCGKDGTSSFNNQHSGQTNPMNMLAGLEIGTLK